MQCTHGSVPPMQPPCALAAPPRPQAPTQATGTAADRQRPPGSPHAASPAAVRWLIRVFSRRQDICTAAAPLCEAMSHYPFDGTKGMCVLFGKSMSATSSLPEGFGIFSPSSATNGNTAIAKPAPMPWDDAKDPQTWSGTCWVKSEPV